MMRMRRTHTLRLLAATLFGLAGATMAQAQAPEDLAPYKMLRSLQFVQDSVVGGDHAAAEMQKFMLASLDRRLRTAGSDVFEDPRNVDAALIYAMSGGNPATLEFLVGKDVEGYFDNRVADALRKYLGGKAALVAKPLAEMMPEYRDSRIGPYLALVSASAALPGDPKAALGFYDFARLAAPGTNVEEAALRRSLAIAAGSGMVEAGLGYANRYARRFLHSPYASQFADTFVSGVIAMHGAMSQDKLADITAMMDAEREKVIYLRIARRAAIDGFADLSAFASAKAEQGRDGKANDDDPRVQLYASLSTVTSATVDTVREKLKTIDRDQLSENDRSLLDAARAVVREMVATPTPAGSVPAAAPTETDAPGEQTSVETDLPPVEGIVGDVPVAPVPVPVATAETKDAAVAADPTDKAIAATRHTLDSIDQMLGVSPQ